ncbi:hypothetical protein WIX39_018655 [Variovorax sp. AB1(2024)]|uniref:glycine-rich domain-containing protein n=1 Tax=Variovorax sp. AB1(2024) TaxID=3132214 RepID=UPI003097340A
MAVYFPLGQQTTRVVRKKFAADGAKARAAGVDGFAFVTNQAITHSTRTTLIGMAAPMLVEIYHLERIVAILDHPPMHTARAQFLGFGGEAPSIQNGGLGGSGLGAGGGGGGVIGSANSRGGDGGKGGNISSVGGPGTAPGAGGGGAGAEGEGAVGGEGGGGGESVVGIFNVADLPKEIPIHIGAGGRGGNGNGEDGGDTTFGDLLRARGGKGGRAGRSTSGERTATADDLSMGLRISALLAAEQVLIRQDGLLYLTACGFEHLSFAQYPAEANIVLAGSLYFGRVEPETRLTLTARVISEAGRVASETLFVVASGPSRAVTRPNFAHLVQWTADAPGVWLVVIASGPFELATLPIELKSLPTP